MDLPTPSQRKMSQVATPLPSTRSRNCTGRRQHNTRQSEMQRSEAPMQPPFLHPETNQKKRKTHEKKPNMLICTHMYFRFNVIYMCIYIYIYWHSDSDWAFQSDIQTASYPHLSVDQMHQFKRLCETKQWYQDRPISYLSASHIGNASPPPPPPGRSPFSIHPLPTLLLIVVMVL